MKHKQDPNLPHWSAYLDKLDSQPASTSPIPPPIEPASEPTPSTSTAHVRKQVSLGIWNFYFIAKFILFGMGLIAFHPWTNLAFAGLLLLFSTMYSWRILRAIIAIALGISLLYHDSWLPPIGRVYSQAALLSNFSAGYFVELLSRFVNPVVIGLLILAGLAYHLIARQLRIGALVIPGMVIIGVIQHLSASHLAEATAKPDMDKVVQSFFAQEAQRSIQLPAPSAKATPFDIIFIHVCSLAWDDVRAVGLENHPLWKHFDILFTKFNSATAYSGPSAIHLLRATCGQQEHSKMYAPVPEKCYLMNSLLRAGFAPELALNHDGKFDNFLGQVQNYGRLTSPPLALDGLNIAQHAFDGTPVYDDLSVLDRWLSNRQQSVSPRVALYYNTISLHDGNQSIDQPGMNSMATYRSRLSVLLDNMERFMNELERSGRRAVVVMVPEHGAAVRGDKKQIAGLREIPTPAITLVPVGIKVVGGNIRRQGDTVSVDQPSSYLAISSIVEHMLQNSPYDAGKYMPANYVSDLPVTQFVAQNENATVAEYNHRYYLKRGTSGWEEE